MANQSSIPLDYEPHINLSINTKTANECRNLSEIRYEIDTIDHFIVKLIQTRMQYALATLKFKLDGKPIPDNGRIIQQLKQRKKWAEKYGLDPKFIESFFKLMIDWYMSQQIAYYKVQKPVEAATLQIKFCSLAELKAMEFGLDWIDILKYNLLLNSGYQKARQMNEPVLVSFTQKASIFSNNHNLISAHLFNLFEQARRLSLSHGFLLAQPSQQFFILALGNAQQFDVNQNISSFNNTRKKIADFTYQEFHSEVKKVVDSGWKSLLLNAIIENCAEKNFSGHGPVLTGGLCFDHQNTRQSEKWSNFGEASFVLPRIQFSNKGGDCYVTFNTVITKYAQLEYESQLIDAEITSLLEFCNELLKGAKQFADGVLRSLFDRDNRTELNQKPVLPCDTWKQTVRDAIVKITNGDFEKVVLAREAEIETDQQKDEGDIGWSLTRLCSLYPSAYQYGVLRQGSCFFGVTSAQLVRLLDNQLESTALTGAATRGVNEIEDKMFEAELFNSRKQRYEHSLVINLIRSKLELITEANSLMIPDEPIVLKLADQQHLYTPVQGTIRKEITLLDLVQTLHPTPAVGGFPQSDALEFIREKENLDRGWFSAPIGWIDANCNGEFVVALRSALINESSISLFADCDIIAGSDPEDKYHETEFKMKTTLFALGDKQAVQEHRQFQNISVHDGKALDPVPETLN